MASIQAIQATEILDSRGLPTVQCAIWLDTGQYVESAAANGTSKGKHEAKELRDNDPNWMVGKGVKQAVYNVNQIIAPALIGKDPTTQKEIDQILLDLDGTKDKSKLGSNALIAVSQAVLKAGAMASNLPIYYYIMQKYQLANGGTMPSCIYTVVNGGEHGADNLDIQEFELIPASYLDYPTSLNMAVTIFQKLKEVLISKGAIHSVGVVGGFTPNLFNNTDAFEILVETIKATPYSFAQDVFFGADMAAGSLQQGKKYVLKDRQQPYTSKDLIEYYRALRNSYQVFYIEDPFGEDDWESWKQLTTELGPTTMISGDTLLSQSDTLDKAIKEKVCNTLLLKPNHFGTISESIEVAQKAKEAGWQIVVSHRSGETNDTLMADLAVGIGANYVKFGPPNRGERVIKYNRLMEIYLQLQQMNAQPPAETATTPATVQAETQTQAEQVTPAVTDPAAAIAPATTNPATQPTQ